MNKVCERRALWRCKRALRMAHKHCKSPKQDSKMMKMMIALVHHHTTMTRVLLKKCTLRATTARSSSFLMCMGLMHGGCSVFDFDGDPWKTIKRQDIKPSRSEYAQEVSWHGTLLKMHCIPKTVNWTLTNCIEWLEANPLTKDE